MQQSLAWAHSSTLTTRSAFLPVPNSANTEADPVSFKLAPPRVMLHEYILLPGWVKKPEFEALCQWLTAQGFVIVSANGPAPQRTYPDVKFHGTVAQFNQAFRVTVMEKLSIGGWCYSVFTNLLMPARFAPKGEDYIDGYSFGDEEGVGLRNSCR
jgi:hypothetical protein